MEPEGRTEQTKGRKKQPVPPAESVAPPPGIGPVTSLSDVESEVMALAWEIGRPAHAMEVAEASLYRRRARGLEPIGFATVNTTLRRLGEKGLLTVSKGKGGPRDRRKPYYAPAVGREETAARVLDHASRLLLGSPLAALIPRLTGLSKTAKGSGGEEDREKLARLMRALDEAAGEYPGTGRGPGSGEPPDNG